MWLVRWSVSIPYLHDSVAKRTSASDYRTNAIYEYTPNVAVRFSRAVEDGISEARAFAYRERALQARRRRCVRHARLDMSHDCPVGFARDGGIAILVRDEGAC